MKNTNKITLYNKDRIVIENYNEIIDVENEKIKIDDYIINGLNLKIKEISDYYIIITGNIFYIDVKKEN